MAILKHISSRNSSYLATLDYLMYKHDEFKKVPILDDTGLMIPRENMLIDGLNITHVNLFPIECVHINKEYHQNRLPSDVKSHHFIISFDPNDIPDHNLTVKADHALALDYASKCFPGHQAVVATHEDGHNGSHNIHSHIVINSTRMIDIKLQAFMDRDADCKAGKKIRVTDAFMKYLKKELMDICEANGLYQVDLLSPAKDFLADKTINGKLPTVKMLREKKAELTSLRNTYYEEKLSTQRAFREASTFYENTKLIDESYKKRQKGRFNQSL